MATFEHGSLLGAIDQGTSSTRFLVFDTATAKPVPNLGHQIELRQIFPDDGWVEEDPKEIMETIYKTMEETARQMKERNIDPHEIKAIGVSNQRETTILWDSITGEPLHNALVWLDLRTADTVDKFISRTPGENKDYLQYKCGLPLSTYFSAVKISWLIENVPAVRDAIFQRRCMFGTVDSWIIWNLTGGINGGVHMTDVTNASRTMLMNVTTLEWDPELYKFFDIPPHILPEIRSSSEVYGTISSGPLQGVPIGGCLGDQSAALVGQLCFKKGMAKNTYGTGCFMLYNTGSRPIFSKHGLLTTVGYKFGKEGRTAYALEGSVAIAGAAIRWLRDNLELIRDVKETEALASSVDSTHGVYFVPAFSGLFAPHWEFDARGLIIGLTQFTTKAHIVRAALEAVCFQTREILEAMRMDSNITLKALRVDGGMCSNKFLLQNQADTIGIPVVLPRTLETTALGAALAAGNAVRVWSMETELPGLEGTFTPKTSEEVRDATFRRWKEAVNRCMHWEGHRPPESLLDVMGIGSTTVSEIALG